MITIKIAITIDIGYFIHILFYITTISCVFTLLQIFRNVVDKMEPK